MLIKNRKLYCENNNMLLLAFTYRLLLCLTYQFQLILYNRQVCHCIYRYIPTAQCTCLVTILQLRTMKSLQDFTEVS